MDAHYLLKAHRYADAIAACRRRLTADPNDIGTADTLAEALRAVGAYKEALPLFERVGEDERNETPGHPEIKQISPACIGAWAISRKQSN
jgi:hypothetical protein